MSIQVYSQKEESIAARALMSHRTPEERLHFVARETGRGVEYAEELLAHARKQFDQRVAQTRGFVSLMSSGAEDMARNLLILHGLIAAGTLGLAVYFAVTGQWVFAVACLGISVSNVWVGLQARQRSQRLARRETKLGE